MCAFRMEQKNTFFARSKPSVLEMIWQNPFYPIQRERRSGDSETRKKRNTSVVVFVVVDAVVGGLLVVVVVGERVELFPTVFAVTTQGVASSSIFTSSSSSSSSSSSIRTSAGREMISEVTSTLIRLSIC